MELSDPKIAQLDLAYHDIKRGRGVFDLLQRKGLAARVTTDEDIAEGGREPAADHPAPGCAANSSAPRRRRAATSLSTGFTSNSTTRRSAPCYARTRSARSTSGSNGSSPACSDAAGERFLLPRAWGTARPRA